MPSEVGAAVWIPLAVTALAGLLAWGWHVFHRSIEKSESNIAKDVERVEQNSKSEIARLDKRIDDHRADQIRLSERTAVNESEIRRLKEDIGDHGSGLRGWLHSIANATSPVVQWFTAKDRWKDDK